MEFLRKYLLSLRQRKGFSLVEILVVVAVLGIAISVGSSLLMTILHSASKARVLTEVKQNGDYASNLMERSLRNARDIVDSCGGVSPCTDSYISFNNEDYEAVVFSCEVDGDGINTIMRTIGGNTERLINNIVQVVDCSSVFTIDFGTAGVSPDVITINFTLSQVTGTRVEETAQVSFLKKVTLRNFR